MSNPIRRVLKTADIIAGAIAVLLAIPSLDTGFEDPLERVILIFTMVGSLWVGWFLARERYWMVKIFLYAGVMLLFTLIVRLLFRLIGG